MEATGALSWDRKFKQGVQRIMGEISALRGVEWWDFYDGQSPVTSEDFE